MGTCFRKIFRRSHICNLRLYGVLQYVVQKYLKSLRSRIRFLDGADVYNNEFNNLDRYTYLLPNILLLIA